MQEPAEGQLIVVRKGEESTANPAHAPQLKDLPASRDPDYASLEDVDPGGSVIFIKRVAKPPHFEFVAPRGRRLAKQFFDQPPSRRKQDSFDYESVFSQSFWDVVLHALVKQFHGKCAYCESVVSPLSISNIDWFRPRRGVAETSGKYLRDHYWAQAFEWENLYLCCATCNRYKANRFPVVGKRAAADANRKELSTERALLVDPCQDDPEQHLLYTPDGKVSGKTEEGLATIEVLGLNRMELVSLRGEFAEQFFDSSGAGTRSLMAPDQPFLALKRTLLQHKLLDAKSVPRGLRWAVEYQREFDAKMQSAMPKGPGLKRFRSSARFIERIEIRNIASIRHLVLDLSSSTAATAPCFALLGENGAGKSTILKCIALALAGPSLRAATGVKASTFLRTKAAQGSVRVWMSGFSKPAEMIVVRQTGQFRFQQPESRAPILAYGSSRLLPTGSNRPSKARQLAMSKQAKIANLFNPFLPLMDIERWLRAIGPEMFDNFALVLKELLPVAGDAHFYQPRRASSPVTVKVGPAAAQPLNVLSDGYQSMLGLAADIMQMLHRLGYQNMRSAQGVVLIDELGNHLHPAWRMRVVSSLRRAFPQIQFIFSTHDPLCLRGMQDGEVAVIRVDNKTGPYALDNLPSIEGMRVDQLLMSEHFGLDTVFDPEWEELVERYRELAARSKRNRTEEAEFQELVAKLTDLRLLGRTWRERLALEAVDLQLRKLQVPDAGHLDAKKVAQSAVTAVAKLMSSASSRKPRAVRGSKQSPK